MLTKLKMSTNEIAYRVSDHIQAQAGGQAANSIGAEIDELVGEQIRLQTEVPVRWPCWGVTQTQLFANMREDM